jgi:CIC family chloride channel protein
MELLVRQLRKLPKRTRTVLQTCLYGLGAGGAAVAFQLAIKWIYNAGLVRFSTQPLGIFLAASFGIMAGSSLIVGWLLNSFCREAAGSGIPQLKLAFWKDFGTVPWRVAWVKFVAGVISLGGGSSLGREGPSVQLAGAVGSNLAAWTGEAKQSRRAGAAAGAAAGLAAAFNTPLAATTFVLEEIIGDLNSRFLGAVLFASVIGALIVQGIIGKQPSFTLRGADAPSWVGYALTPLVAAVASLVGVLFQRASLGLRLRVKQRPRPHPWLIPFLGALITWMLGSIVFWRTGRLGVFSLGYEDLSDALAGNIGWILALTLLLTKLSATIACYGFGGCGGIFSPTLFFGGMTGVAIAGLVSLGWPVARADALTLAVVGMSACLGAVVWAPVTGILIVFEMTHEFSLVPALMLGALVSQTISRRLNRENFYEALLTQDGHRIEHVRPPRDLQSWQSLPVSTIANFRPVTLTSLQPTELSAALRDHPYDRFPVVIDGKPAGVLSRREAEASQAQGRIPQLEPATLCRPAQTIRELQGLIIQSSSQFVIIAEPNGPILGLITLHDLLRAEVEKASQSDD